MESVLIAVGAFVAYLIAYKTYGKFLARRIFRLDAEAVTPAKEINDGRDYVPTKLEVLFGHHYTSIAGTGPIVGPAIGIIWGWVPALIWVLLGSVFMGAVHDFGALIISARNQGKSIGDVADKVISRRVRLMFMFIVLLCLLIVIAVFCLVIAALFNRFPQAVIPIWVEIPIAVVIGHLVYRKNMNALLLSIVGVILLYAFVVVGAYVPVEMPALDLPLLGKVHPIESWTVILLIYAFIASVLPVWRLLQPRDYINGHELFVVLFVLMLGVLVAHPTIVAPAFSPAPEGIPLTPGAVIEARELPDGLQGKDRIALPEKGKLAPVLVRLDGAGDKDRYRVDMDGQKGKYFVSIEEKTGDHYAVSVPVGSEIPVFALPKETGEKAPKPDKTPLIFPFLFITIACGAISGFHSLVGSGTTSKQLSKENHALVIGYGGMLLEGALAVLVILAVSAGIGLGAEGGLTGAASWKAHYASWSGANSLGAKVGAFVTGASNMLKSFGIPVNIGITIMGVFVASFAATTLDTATRLQRYVIAELASGVKLHFLSNIYIASALAVISGGALALAKKGGAGGLILWPLFGATNQLLACLALLVITVYLKKRGRPTAYTLIPMLIMLVLTGVAMAFNLRDFYLKGTASLHLFLISAVIVVLEGWMVIESLVLWVRGIGEGEVENGLFTGGYRSS